MIQLLWYICSRSIITFNKKDYATLLRYKFTKNHRLLCYDCKYDVDINIILIMIVVYVLCVSHASWATIPDYGWMTVGWTVFGVYFMF